MKISYVRQTSDLKFLIDPSQRDTIQSMTFNDSSSVFTEWRGSIWPDSLITNDSILLGYISQDTLLGTMRIEMVEDVNNEEEGIIFGATTRKLTGLEVGKKYEASFEIQTDGNHQLKQVNSVAFRNSEFSMGMIIPVDTNMINIDSLDIGIDSIVLRFTATESDMVISISANSRIAAPYHYYIDNFNLRKGFETVVNCDKSNLQYADRAGSYRFGFNGMEREDEISSGDYDFGARIYDSRLGRFYSMDPLQIKYPFSSPYVFVGNNPIIFIDPTGKVVTGFDELYEIGRGIALKKLNHSETWLKAYNSFSEINGNNYDIHIEFSSGSTESSNSSVGYGSAGVYAKVNGDIVRLDKISDASQIVAEDIFINITISNNALQIGYGEQALIAVNHEFTLHALKYAQWIRQLKNGEMTADKFLEIFKEEVATNVGQSPNTPEHKLINDDHSMYNQINRELVEYEKSIVNVHKIRDINIEEHQKDDLTRLIGVVRNNTAYRFITELNKVHEDYCKNSDDCTDAYTIPYIYGKP